MIPAFIELHNAEWPVLPPGIYEVTLDEVKLRYATTPHRRDLFNGLKAGLINLFNCGCPMIFLDGSYVTAKPKPKDYEVCWDTRYVDPTHLDPLFFEPIAGGTYQQKRKYKGEYFPAYLIELRSGVTFLDFFQIDKQSGNRKGILKIRNFLTAGGTI
jgi:hypothetical protein